MRIGMGQAAGALPNYSTGITVSGYNIGTPTEAQDLIALNAMPLMGSVGESASDQAIANAALTAAGNPPAPTTVNWGMIAAIVGGAVVLLMAVKK